MNTSENYDSSPQEKPKKNNIISKETIFKTIVGEAAGLYNLMITVSTGVFGITLIFLEKIAPKPTMASLIFLMMGWLLLILCIVSCLVVRWNNIESGRNVLERNKQASRKIDKINRILTKGAIIFLIAGMVSVAIYACLNILSKIKINEGSITMIENEKETEPVENKGKKEIIERAIPFASTQDQHQDEQVEDNEVASEQNAEDIEDISSGG